MWHKARQNKILKRVLALVMAVALAVPVLNGLEIGAAAAESTGDVKLSLAWGESEFVSGNACDVVEDSNTSNIVRMRVSYSDNEPLAETYEAGELVISVKGIGGVARGSNLQATVGADAATSTVKQRDWSYTYNSKTDTYTFTNNEAIEEGTVFSGYFELAWSLYARNTENSYSQDDIQAVLYLPDGSEVQSETLSFSNQTTQDTFAVTVEEKDKIASAAGFSDYVDNVNNYIWEKYAVQESFVKNSRGLVDSEATFVLSVDTGGIGSDVVVFAPEVDVEELYSDTYPDGTTATGQLFALDMEAYPYNSTVEYVYVGYPIEEYAEQTVSVKFAEYGEYYEGTDDGTEGVVELASSTINIAMPSAFIFADIPGDIYDADKTSAMYSEINREYKGGDIQGVKLADGYEVEWDMLALLNVASGESYTLDFVDDVQYILQDDGTYRMLATDEYEITKVRIPGIDCSDSTIENENGFTIKENTYGVEVYAVQGTTVMDESDATLVYSGKLKKSSYNVTLPAGTNAVAVKITGISESISSISIPVYVKYNVDAETANLSTGYLDNLMFIRVYNKNGTDITTDIDEGAYLDFAETGIMDYDTGTYNRYLDREKFELQLYPAEKQDYQATATLSSVEYTGNKYVTTATIGATFDFEDDEPSQFTLYTILPEGTSLNGYNGLEESLTSIISISGMDDMDAETLMDCCTPTVIEDYEGSGRTYIALSFDFSDELIFEQTNIYASFQIQLEKEFFQDGNTVAQLYSAVMIDQTIEHYLSGKSADTGYWGDNTELFSDIDGDGDTDEYLAAASASTYYIYAASSQFSLKKYVKTDYTDGYTADSTGAKVQYDGTYRYRLEVENGNNKAKNVVIRDILETGDNSKWHGTFQAVDTSYLTNKGYTVTVWYSTVANPGEVGGSDWTTICPDNVADVTAVAFDLGESTVEAGATLHVDILMTATDDESLRGQSAENGFSAKMTTIDSGTGIETAMDYLDSNLVQVELTPELGTIIVKKVDAEDDSALYGAKIRLLDSEGNTVATATSNYRGYAIFENLEMDGVYIAHETTAPAGYELAEDIMVTPSGKTYYVTMEDERKTGTITVSKTSDIDSTAAIAGAEFTLTHPDGTTETGTTGDDGTVTFTDLEWGVYEVEETAAPAGYSLPDETTQKATLNAKNVSSVQTVTFTDPQDDTTVSLIKYAAMTDGTETTIPVQNAAYKLYRINSDGTETGKATYITDTTGEIYIDDTLPYGNYVFREATSPRGYELDENDIEFTLSADTQDVKLVTYDKRKSGTLTIVKKSDYEDSPVVGAVFALYDASYQVIGDYTTDDAGVITVSGLEWGTYFAKEKTAPQGFVLDTEYHEFSISAQTLNAELDLTNETKKGSIRITKTDETGNVTLAGAEFSLYKNDGILVKSGLTTGTDGTFTVSGLEWGIYYLEETKAPDGYSITSETVRFAINASTADVLQEISVTDPQDAKVVTVTKKIKADDVNFANGTPSFIFELTGTDTSGNEYTYHRMVTFTEAIVSAPDAEGYVELSTTFSGITAGTYTLSEEGTARYKLTGISDVSDNGTISSTKDSVEFDMTGSNNEGSATFTNRNYEAQYFSDSDGVTNTLKKSRKLTGISVTYSGENTLDSGTEIDRSWLTVTALYDDGESVVLGDNEYSLSAEVVPHQSGKYLVTVTYEEGGITKKGDFSFKVNPVGTPVSISAVPVSTDAVSTEGSLDVTQFVVTLYYSDGSSRILGDEEKTATWGAVDESTEIEATSYTATKELQSSNWPSAYNHGDTEDEYTWIYDESDNDDVEYLFLVFDSDSELDDEWDSCITVYDKDGNDITKNVTFADGETVYEYNYDDAIYGGEIEHLADVEQSPYLMVIPGNYAKITWQSTSYTGFSASTYASAEEVMKDVYTFSGDPIKTVQNDTWGTSTTSKLTEADNYWEISSTDGGPLYLTFDEDSKLGYSGYLRFYDADGNNITKSVAQSCIENGGMYSYTSYSSDYLLNKDMAGETYVIPGGYVKITFEVTGTYYSYVGFQCDAYDSTGTEVSQEFFHYGDVLGEATSTISTENYPDDYPQGYEDEWTLQAENGNDCIFLTFSDEINICDKFYGDDATYLQVFDTAGNNITGELISNETGRTGLGDYIWYSAAEGETFTIPYTTAIVKYTHRASYKGFHANVYTDAECLTPAETIEYSLSMDKVPATEGEFTVTITYTDEDTGKTFTTDVNMTAEQKPDVKYAVTIYGIQEDVDEDGNVLGLTFGPATGANYEASYVSCDSEYCIHNMTWSEIIEQSAKDPTVFESCLDHGCTKSVDLYLNDTIIVDRETNADTLAIIRQSLTGDGYGVLNQYVINSSYLTWNADMTGDGWASSHIRATLNGENSDTDSTYAGTDNLTEDTCLLSCFPEELQNGIVAKKVVSSGKKYTSSGYISAKSSFDTYDKLWLFDEEELFAAQHATGTRYLERYSKLSTANTWNNGNLGETETVNSLLPGYARYQYSSSYGYVGFNTYWLRSTDCFREELAASGSSQANYVQTYYGSYGGSNRTVAGKSRDSVTSARALAPGFCLR